MRTLPTAGTCNVLRTDTASHRAVLAEGRQAATLFEAHPSALRLPFTVEQLPVIADDSAEDISAHTKQAAIFRLEVT
ncbi:hypothetical protein ACIRU3_23050 [Streptomyces sp. NPDC101151]|uniref:hypothetical protein n=1 Tax=Streptomyces sp. NPDC101151 TaxID=3366115 RepID=UPI0038216DD0